LEKRAASKGATQSSRGGAQNYKTIMHSQKGHNHLEGQSELKAICALLIGLGWSPIGVNL